MNNCLRSRANSCIRARCKRTAKGYDNNTLSKNWVCLAIYLTGAIPVLLQQSLMHSGSARSSQTIIYPARYNGLKVKLPDLSNRLQPAALAADRIIHLDFVKEKHRQHHDHAGNRTDDNGAQRGNRCAWACNRHQTGQGAI
jgi:hypothetical protein